MNKIYIYEAEVIKARQNFKNTIVNYVKLTRPEGLEEHWPNVGDIVNLYFPGNIIYMKHKVIGKQNDGIYIIALGEVDDPECNVKIDYLKDEILKSLLHLPEDINNEFKGVSKLTKEDIDLNKNLSLYFDISIDTNGENVFYKYVKTQVIKTIKDKIKNIDVWVDPDHCGDIEVYTNEPTIEEVIDKDYNANDGKFKFKGIIEKDIHLYRIIIRTNIYEK